MSCETFSNQCVCVYTSAASGVCIFSTVAQGPLNFVKCRNAMKTFQCWGQGKQKNKFHFTSFLPICSSTIVGTCTKFSHVVCNNKPCFLGFPNWCFLIMVLSKLMSGNIRNLLFLATILWGEFLFICSMLVCYLMYIFNFYIFSVYVFSWRLISFEVF